MPAVIATSAVRLARHGDPQMRKMLLRTGRQAIKPRLTGRRIF